MREKLAVLGFVAGLLVWFAVAVATLLQLDQVAENSAALNDQSLPVPAPRPTPAQLPIFTAQADPNPATPRP